MPSPLSPRGEAGSQYPFWYFCLDYANLYLTVHLTTAVCFAYILAFFVVYDGFLLSNYDLQNIMFVLSSWHHFNLQCRIGQLQLISSKCCPVLPEAWAQANAGAHAEPVYSNRTTGMIFTAHT